MQDVLLQILEEILQLFEFLFLLGLQKLVSNVHPQTKVLEQQLGHCICFYLLQTEFGCSVVWSTYSAAPRNAITKAVAFCSSSQRFAVAAHQTALCTMTKMSNHHVVELFWK